MIFKKQTYSKKSRQLWPFSVPEVAVVASTVESNGKMINAYIIVHNFGVFALSGILEGYDIPPLDDSGIWLDDMPGVKRSLRPFFDLVRAEMLRVKEGQGDRI